MIFKVLQIQIPSAIYKDVNSIGHDGVAAKHPVYAAHLAVSFRGSLGYKAEHFEHFTLVAEITAADLDAAFALGNGYGDMKAVRRLDAMHSVSVGDIVVDDAGVHHMVDGIGFTALPVGAL